MKIFTTYFANVRNLPQHIVPISISGKAPDWWNGLEYKRLAPKYSFFSVWKETQDNEYYIKHFYEEVLSKLTPKQVIDDIVVKLPQETTFALVCYEAPNKFCHRHLVAEWLKTDGDIEVEEF